MKDKKVFTRYTVITAMLIVMFLLIILKLADIQIVRGQEYRELAADKSIRKVDDDAPRGKILDRNGIELASNIQRYMVYMMKPQGGQEKEFLNQSIEKLVDILNKNSEKVNDEFPISLKLSEDGKYSFEFIFPNNYEDPDKRQEYINKAAAKWKSDNGIEDYYTAEQSFYYLKTEYGINPVKDEHDNIPFIRQMMVIRQMIKNKGYMAYKPIEIAYVNKATAFEIMEKSLYLPGIDTELEPQRSYPFGELASIVIGGLRKIPGEEAEKYRERQYDINSDLIGRNGIEAYAEEYLRGEKGGRTVRVDAFGRIVEELGKRDPIPGNNVVLTIDKNLQEVAEKSLDDVMQKLRDGELAKDKYPNATRGGAVVIDIKSGEILAMASRPGGFDPNIMAATGGFNEEVRKKLYPRREEHPDILTDRIPKPMFNYATQGAVPPGSTFKMITAIAGLETGKTTPSEIIIDRGVYEVVKGFNGACWLWNKSRMTHGPVNLARAIQISCNYYFFEIGRRVGLENITHYARMFGLASESSGIEIDESPGDVANKESIRELAEILITRAVLQEVTTPEYDKNLGTFNPTDEQKVVIENVIKNRNDENASALSEKLVAAGISSYKIRRRILDGTIQMYYEYNKPGIPLNASIGQGENRFTPLQVASYIATLANGGTRYKPHLVKEIVKPDGAVIEDREPEVINKVDVKPSTIAAVKAGMNSVVDDGGTAAGTFKGFQIKTAGKTGTAQASGGMDDYSWFSGFAPADNPEIAVAVVIYEGGGYGTSNVARAIYEQYFGLNKTEQ